MFLPKLGETKGSAAAGQDELVANARVTCALWWLGDMTVGSPLTLTIVFATN
jgi:hypothetical protein